MLDHYNIHDERDQREALRATQAYRGQPAAMQREKLATMPAVGRAWGFTDRKRTKHKGHSFTSALTY